MSGLAGPPSASLLCYLCADELLETYYFHRPYDSAHGQLVPCRDAAVAPGPLAGLLLAAAFWGLLEAGLITLTPGASGNERGTAPLAVAARGQADRPGLEGLILRQCTKAFAPARDVPGAVYAWFNGVAPKPYEVVVGAVIEEGVARGWFATAPRRTRPGQQIWLGDAIYTPQCAKLAALQEQLADTRRRWQQFRRDETTLSGVLRAQCLAAIEGSQAPPSNEGLAETLLIGARVGPGRHRFGLIDLLGALLDFLARR